MERLLWVLLLHLCICHASQPTARSPIGALRVAKDGSCSAVEVTRASLAAELGCPLRDLRIVDPSFPNSFPTILSRKKAIIVSLGPVKAVITADNALFSAQDSSTREDLVERMQAQLSTGALEPFERIAMEVCLKKLCSEKMAEFIEVTPRLRAVLNELRMGGPSLSRRLDELLPLKNKLDELHSTVADVCKCISDVLINDEDMMQMYLTPEPKKRSAQDHEEVEILFENYFLQMELLESSIRECQDEVKNTEEVVEIQLDVLRNRILRFELTLSMSGFMVAVGALLTGVFGMNLTSHLETHPYLFWVITALIYGSIAASWVAAAVVGRRQGLL